ncbi:hypothetical protein FB390_3104 [Nocardia bhagyanarayanae]|uniref:Uncharacterized protein n=1 Tax=Nocardia bhagyanarayanae TaxID=1215925 RepID=A0A543FCM6_9NOCA|nr:hypothetical protein FB390_3104 [Nocardia bhagyanarayanae]
MNRVSAAVLDAPETRTSLSRRRVDSPGVTVTTAAPRKPNRRGSRPRQAPRETSRMSAPRAAVTICLGGEWTDKPIRRTRRERIPVGRLARAAEVARADGKADSAPVAADRPNRSKGGRAQRPAYASAHPAPHPMDTGCPSSPRRDRRPSARPVRLARDRRSTSLPNTRDPQAAERRPSQATPRTARARTATAGSR